MVFDELMSDQRVDHSFRQTVCIAALLIGFAAAIVMQTAPGDAGRAAAGKVPMGPLANGVGVPALCPGIARFFWHRARRAGHPTPRSMPAAGDCCGKRQLAALVGEGSQRLIAGPSLSFSTTVQRATFSISGTIIYYTGHREFLVHPPGFALVSAPRENCHAGRYA